MAYVDVDDYVRQVATAGAHSLKARIYLRQKDFDMVLYELKLAASIRPDQLSIYSLRSEMYIFQGKYRNAVSDIATWVDIQNDRNSNFGRATPFAKLVIIYLSQQDIQTAKKYFITYRGNKERFDRIFTFDDVELRNIFSLLDESNFAKAQEEVQKILKDISPGKETERVENQNKYYAELLLAAYIAEMAGNLDLALSYCKKAQIVNSNPQSITEIIQRLRSKISTRNSQDKTPPTIQVLRSYAPDVNGGRTNTRYVKLLGKATDEGGISWVKVNGQAVKRLESDGFFMYDGNVSGDNIMVEASDRNANIVRKEVILYPSQIQDPETVRARYHAVIIACERYGNMGYPPIQTIDQSVRFRQILENKYGFQKNNITNLLNATYEDIVRQMSNKMESLGPADNLIIYFAGHGKFTDTDKGRIGYWVPLNAKNESEYISSNKLSILLDSCKARQILVISDACFSASMVSEEKNSQIQMDMSLSTRQILTSGSLEGVPARSFFIDAIIETLANNTLPILPAVRLHSRIVEPVMDKTGKTPLLMYCGDGGNMGGQFQFRQTQSN